MVSPQLQYAMQLLSQSRYDLAESAVRRVLGEDPDNATAHALLALCYVGLKDFAKAMQEAEMAIGVRQQPSFWQRAGMELRDVWLDAWKNVGVYKGPDIYEQRGQEISAYRGTTTFEIDKASVYLESLEGFLSLLSTSSLFFLQMS